jgi:hypothetical protein
VQDEDAAIAAVINAAELKLEQHLSKRGQGSGRCNYGNADSLLLQFHSCSASYVKIADQVGALGKKINQFLYKERCSYEVLL